MEIKIEQKQVTVVSKITVDGKEFPIHQWNVDVAERYLATNDEKHLKNLKDFALSF